MQLGSFFEILSGFCDGVLDNNSFRIYDISNSETQTEEIENNFKICDDNFGSLDSLDIDLKNMIDENNKSIESNDNLIELNNNLENMIDENNNLIESNDNLIEENDNLIESNNNLIESYLFSEKAEDLSDLPQIQEEDDDIIKVINTYNNKYIINNEKIFLKDDDYVQEKYKGKVYDLFKTVSSDGSESNMFKTDEHEDINALLESKGKKKRIIIKRKKIKT